MTTELYLKIRAEYHEGNISPVDLAKKYNVGIVEVMDIIFKKEGK